MIKSRLREILLDREKAYDHPYSIKGVAEAAGLSENTVSNLRAGKTARYDAKVLDSLCRILDIQVGDLLVYMPDEE